MSEAASTTVSRLVDAPSEAIFRAYLDPEAVAAWLPPGSMRAIVHAFEAREGGAFSMSLVYPDDDDSSRGKSSEKTDTFRGRFASLVRDRRITWAVEFDSPDPSFSGEMIVDTMLQPLGKSTEVTITCSNIPPGISREDNEEGTRSTLEKLAAYVESG
ncbi:MAG: SRPBCC family protein [Phyllobacterium sp.]|uniref:SRPBCC family protein n=1 Tax=Phyllobacterium sp. TaxID=1871046 RepID=UPI0030F2BED7